MQSGGMQVTAGCRMRLELGGICMQWGEDDVDRLHVSFSVVHLSASQITVAQCCHSLNSFALVCAFNTSPLRNSEYPTLQI